MGGGEINLQQMTKTLSESADVSVLTSKFDDLPSYERVGEVKIYRKLETGKSASGIWNNFKRSFSFPSSIVREVKKMNEKHNYDVIHFVGTSIIAAKSLSCLGIPLVATIESYPSLCPKGDRFFEGKQECRLKCSFAKFVKCQSKCEELGKTKNNWYLKYNPLFLAYVYMFHARIKRGLNYCRLIAISEYVKYVLKKHGHGSVVIPNMIEINKFKPRKSGLERVGQALGVNLSLVKKKVIKNDKKKVLYLGSLTKYKGPQTLLQAVKGLDMHVDFYGNGPLKEELQEYIDHNKLDAEIHAQVAYEKIPEIYAESDIVVFPSIWPEPFGRIAVEGLAAGKVVIGSNIAAIKETMQSEGLLYKPGSVQELHKALKENFSPNEINLDRYLPKNVTQDLINFYAGCETKDDHS
tara:strand:- start:6467 stop:7693 length:1227 start_codon:yes stop_codon:yes gene_type:complete